MSQNRGTNLLQTVAALLLGSGVLALAWVLYTIGMVPSQRDLQDEKLAELWASLQVSQAKIGQTEAVHTAVVFTDYECRLCFAVDGILRQLVDEFPGKLRLIIRHNPLRALHPGSEELAAAAACAAEANAFSEVHPKLFELGRTSGPRNWGELARGWHVGSPDTFAACVETNRRSDAASEDILLASALGIRRLPSVIVDGEFLGPTPTAAELRTRITK